eukprot:1074291-Rhodomonas_salina.2
MIELSTLSRRPRPLPACLGPEQLYGFDAVFHCTTGTESTTCYAMSSSELCGVDDAQHMNPEAQQMFRAQREGASSEKDLENPRAGAKGERGSEEGSKRA